MEWDNDFPKNSKAGDRYFSKRHGKWYQNSSIHGWLLLPAWVLEQEHKDTRNGTES